VTNSTTTTTHTHPAVASGRLDVATVRKDFPILERSIHGSPLVYLDSAATTQRPNQVIDAISDFYHTKNANIHRGVYVLSAQATGMYEDARGKVADFIGAPETEEVIFTRNATEAINLVARSWGDTNLKAGDEILLTEMEHHSNLVPWFLLARRTGATVRFLPMNDDGTLDMSAWDERFTERTRVVGAVHVSNVLGTINPVEEIIRRAHEGGAIVVIDGAQSVPHMPVDVRELGADFLAFSAHKMLGPTGIGVLYGRQQLLDNMEPFLGGGDMIRTVTTRGATWNDLPWKFEAGTPNIEGAIAFGTAIDYLRTIGMDTIRAHEVELTGYALERMRKLDALELYGPDNAEQRAGVISFNDRDVHPHDLGTILDRRGVAVRAGHHCAQPLIERLGQSATARASFYLYNTREEVDVLVDALVYAKEFFDGV
jgi:cysteine desulfurase/selenocysteine lyase